MQNPFRTPAPPSQTSGGWHRTDGLNFDLALTKKLGRREGERKGWSKVNLYLRSGEESTPQAASGGGGGVGAEPGERHGGAGEGERARA